jgi:hypothetical protein
MFTRMWIRICATSRRSRGSPDRVSVKISAPTAILEYDTRDNIFTPTRGVYAETSYLASRQALGASVDFERVQQVLIGWMPLRHDITLAARANYAWSSAQTPFFLRPYIMLRGVPSVRYQGDQAASIEVEGRWQFYGRWSIVAFGGAGKAWTNSDSNSLPGVCSGGPAFATTCEQFGLRGHRCRAWPTALYFVVGNAWFGPVNVGDGGFQRSGSILSSRPLGAAQSGHARLQ